MPEVIRVETELKGAKELARNLEAGREVVLRTVNRTLRAIGRLLVPALKATTPRRTGKLARKTVFEVSGQAEDQALQVRQGAKTPQGLFYGHFVRAGTRPHTIYPRQKMALHFFIGEREVFAKVVHHPGNRPNPYHLRAWGQVSPQVDQLIQKAGFTITSFLADTK